MTARAVARKPGVAILLLDPHLTVAGQPLHLVRTTLNLLQLKRHGEEQRFGGYGMAGRLPGKHVQAFLRRDQYRRLRLAGIGSSLASFTGGGGIRRSRSLARSRERSQPVLPPARYVRQCQGDLTINPGLYVDRTAALSHEPGICYVTNGISIRGTLVGHGVMIYNVGRQHRFKAT